MFPDMADGHLIRVESPKLFDRLGQTLNMVPGTASLRHVSGVIQPVIEIAHDQITWQGRSASVALTGAGWWTVYTVPDGYTDQVYVIDLQASTGVGDTPLLQVAVTAGGVRCTLTKLDSVTTYQSGVLTQPILLDAGDEIEGNFAHTGNGTWLTRFLTRRYIKYA